MLSKNTLKFIKSLHQKKIRKQEQLFFVEGSKNVSELLSSDFEVTHLLFTEKFATEKHKLLADFQGNLFETNQKSLEQAGTFLSNDSALAVAKMKANTAFSQIEGEWVIALDEVRDPGNLGTIIRIADWYGIHKIALSEVSAEFYNPKVLHATMGSFTRCNVYYTDLKEFFKGTKFPIYGAFLDGQNIHQTKFGPTGIIVMGNESHGISDELNTYITHKITIPKFGEAESLNVAVATAVICDNVRSNVH